MLREPFWVCATVVGLIAILAGPPIAPAQEPAPGPIDVRGVPANAWVKLSPLGGTPVSPRLGYEGACVWDSRSQMLIRYGGHNQGGGGEQGSEIWTFNPKDAQWKLHEPNTSPPGICCGQQNVFDPIAGRYVRFPAFSASHGWQWMREVYLNDASVLTYDLPANTWRNLRPLPTAHPRPLRCATWDSEHQVIVVFGGEGSSEGTWVYDPAVNTWTRMNPNLEPAGRSGGNMAYDSRRKLHILFGSQFDDDRHTWAYDLRTNTWRDLAPTEMPPTDKNDAVLTYDSAAGRVLAIVKITTGKDDEATHRLETWAYDAGSNRWTKLNPAREPDPTSNRARQLMFAPELGVALLENRPGSARGPEQQIWAYRFAADSADAQSHALSTPRELAVSTKDSAATLAWQAPQDGKVASYAIYRGSGEKPWEVEYAKIGSVGADTLRFEDARAPQAGGDRYFVRALDSTGREGPSSDKVRAQPRLVEDLVVSVLGPQQVALSWKAPWGDDLAGYHIERASVEVLTEDQLPRLKAQTPPLESPSVGAVRKIGPFVRLTQTPITETEFSDRGVDLSQRTTIVGEPIEERRFSGDSLDSSGREYRYGVYAYRVRAVNGLGVESGPSPAVITIPSPPQWVFAKEDGTTCHVKWQANPEQSIRGYRVYRMDGRYSKDAIARLTAEPIAETAHADTGAGKVARRYYVVAVDALGQEGYPSSPAWFEREWQSFYKPFVGEWHQ